MTTLSSIEYEGDSSISLETKLWEGIPLILKRAKEGKQSYDQVITRLKENYLGEKCFFQSIKAHKFESLEEEGTFSRAWAKLRDCFEKLEAFSCNLFELFEKFQTDTVLDKQYYEAKALEIEKEYNDIRKKKHNTVSTLQAKYELYKKIFKEWEDAEDMCEQNSDPTIIEKLRKTAKDKESLMNKTEYQYKDYFQECTDTEALYDQKCTELLRRFERLEYQRLFSLTRRLKEFIANWDNHFIHCRELMREMMTGLMTINVRGDLRTYAERNATGLTRGERHTLDIQKRRNGRGSSSASSSSASSSSSSSSSSPAPQQAQSQMAIQRTQGGTSVPEGKPMVANYDFVAENEGEVSMTKGETVYVQDAKEVGDGWVTIKKKDGQTGYVPTTYLVATVADVRPTSTPGPAPGPAPVPASTTQGSPGSGGGGVRSTVGGGGGGGRNTISHGSGGGAGSAAAAGGVKDGKDMMVIYEFKAENDGEINVAVNEIVFMPDTAENRNAATGGWASVRKKDGGEGYVPFNYLQAPPASSSSSSPSATRTPTPTPTPASSPAGGAGGGGAGGATVMVVAFDYTAETETELSVHAGDQVTIITNNGDGWVYCSNAAGKAGYVSMEYLAAK